LMCASSHVDKTAEVSQYWAILENLCEKFQEKRLGFSSGNSWQSEPSAVTHMFAMIFYKA
jgi:hypothetical protein